MYDAVFIDRDGTINYDPGYISNLDDFKLYPFAIEALKSLLLVAKYLFIVTNQSGVSRGLIELGELEKIHSFLIKKLKKEHIAISRIYVCTDLPNSGSLRRKPESGMFLEAQNDFSINLKNCIMIGDSESDILSGKKLFMETMLLLTGNGQKTREILSGSNTPDYFAKNLLIGAKILNGDNQ